MDKKIIKAMYANATSRDELHPQLCGVHFEENRCYASDGHVLTIFNEGSKSFNGKTIDLDGTVIEGRFPNVDAVFPAKDDWKDFGARIDLQQLQRACAWQRRRIGSNQRDLVVFGDIGLTIEALNRVLLIYQAAGELDGAEIFSTGNNRPVVVSSGRLKSLLMPALFEIKSVDQEREEGCPTAISYGELINDYVFNSWKREPIAEPLAWLQS